jgi:hypothetical protein
MDRCAKQKGLAVESMSRKSVLVSLVVALPVAAIALGATRESASADATVEPSDAQYQSHPKDQQQCSGCQSFVPATTEPAKGDGTCRIVKGAISPQGWCHLYSSKS